MQLTLGQQVQEKDNPYFQTDFLKASQGPVCRDRKVRNDVEKSHTLLSRLIRLSVILPQSTPEFRNFPAWFQTSTCQTPNYLTLF